jgi:hypothetical protein
MVLSLLNANRTTVVDGDDLVDAACDPKVADLVISALAYGDALAASGKDHSLDSG